MMRLSTSALSTLRHKQKANTRLREFRIHWGYPAMSKCSRRHFAANKIEPTTGSDEGKSSTNIL